MTGITSLVIDDNPSLSSLIVNSTALRFIAVGGSALTTLDLSCSTTYNGIYAGNCNLTSITIANGTANEFFATYDLSGNNLSASAINAFFTALGQGTIVEKKKKGLVPPSILVHNNPGSATCDPTIATAKAWAVYTGS